MFVEVELEALMAHAETALKAAKAPGKRQLFGLPGIKKVVCFQRCNHREQTTKKSLHYAWGLRLSQALHISM